MNELYDGINSLRNGEPLNGDKIIKYLSCEFYKCEQSDIYYFINLCGRLIKKDIIAHYGVPYGNAFRLPIYLYGRRYNLIHKINGERFEFKLCGNTSCHNKERNKCKCDVLFTCPRPDKSIKYGSLLIDLYLNTYGVPIKKPDLNPNSITFLLNSVFKQLVNHRLDINKLIKAVQALAAILLIICLLLIYLICR